MLQYYLLLRAINRLAIVYNEAINEKWFNPVSVDVVSLWASRGASIADEENEEEEEGEEEEEEEEIAGTRGTSSSGARADFSVVLHGD